MLLFFRRWNFVKKDELRREFDSKNTTVAHWCIEKRASLNLFLHEELTNSVQSFLRAGSAPLQAVCLAAATWVRSGEHLCSPPLFWREGIPLREREREIAPRERDTRSLEIPSSRRTLYSARNLKRKKASPRQKKEKKNKCCTRCYF